MLLSFMLGAADSLAHAAHANMLKPLQHSVT